MSIYGLLVLVIPACPYDYICLSQCGNMAREGLRTLVVGKKVLSEEQYATFEARYKQARLSVTDREEQVWEIITLYPLPSYNSVNSLPSTLLQ